MAYLDFLAIVAHVAIESWDEQQLARLRPLYPGWDLWTVPLCGGRGYTWCARPAGAPCATINADSPEDLVAAIRQQEADGLELFPMVTTVIAVYGAVVATVSTLLGVWYFARSGPSLQAEASLDPVSIGEEDEWNDDRSILLRVWNTGRAEITVQITGLMISHGRNHWMLHLEGSDFTADKGKVRIGIDGPEVPIRIPGHDGEFWIIEGGFDIRSITPFTSGTLSFLLIVGGNRDVKVPVMDGTYRRIKRRYILKPPRELEYQPEVPATRVVREQPVRQAKRKRSGKR